MRTLLDFVNGKKTTTRSILVLFIAILLSGCSNSSTTTIMAQEKCSLSAKGFFDNYTKDMVDTNISNYGYNNHYNQKLDKCFIMINKLTDVDNKDYQIYERDNRLYNVYENTTPAYILIEGLGKEPIMCVVGDNMCKSEEEFDQLTKSYMEE